MQKLAIDAIVAEARTQVHTPILLKAVGLSTLLTVAAFMVPGIELTTSFIAACVFCTWIAGGTHQKLRDAPLSQAHLTQLLNNGIYDIPQSDSLWAARDFDGYVTVEHLVEVWNQYCATQVADEQSEQENPESLQLANS